MTGFATPSPKIDELLEEDGFYDSLEKCFADEKDQLRFIRTLQLFEWAGKTAGMSGRYAATRFLSERCYRWLEPLKEDRKKTYWSGRVGLWTAGWGSLLIETGFGIRDYVKESERKDAWQRLVPELSQVESGDALVETVQKKAPLIDLQLIAYRVSLMESMPKREKAVEEQVGKIAGAEKRLELMKALEAFHILDLRNLKPSLESAPPEIKSLLIQRIEQLEKRLPLLPPPIDPASLPESLLSSTNQSPPDLKH